MIVNAAVERADGAAESGFGDFVAGEDVADGAGEEEENIEFGAGQIQVFGVLNDAAVFGVDFDVSHGKCIGQGGISFTAENGAHAGDKFADAEGLGEIVVGAAFEAGDAVGFIAAGGEHDYRDAGIHADAAKDFAAVAAGKHYVENDEFVSAFESFLDSGAGIVDGGEVEAVHR